MQRRGAEKRRRVRVPPSAHLALVVANGVPKPSQPASQGLITRVHIRFNVGTFCPGTETTTAVRGKEPGMGVATVAGVVTGTGGRDTLGGYKGISGYLEQRRVMSNRLPLASAEAAPGEPRRRAAPSRRGTVKRCERVAFRGSTASPIGVSRQSTAWAAQRANDNACDGKTRLFTVDQTTVSCLTVLLRWGISAESVQVIRPRKRFSTMRGDSGSRGICRSAAPHVFPLPKRKKASGTLGTPPPPARRAANPAS